MERGDCHGRRRWNEEENVGKEESSQNKYPVKFVLDTDPQTKMDLVGEEESSQNNYPVKFVLDTDPQTKMDLVSLDDKLLQVLKPYQLEGIKFMWDATVTSVQKLSCGDPGNGCILAHCMGLGKTLQVITLCHTLLTNDKTNGHISKIMVCCPVNTIYNWVSEFHNWLGDIMQFPVVELVSTASLHKRANQLTDWWRDGGVCIIGYEMFRRLSNSNNNRMHEDMKNIFQETLCNPGPDMVVCDEGHVLKNEKSRLSKAVNQINTKRRIILTGTPLQNNLFEYHCMIQLVRPNLLGSKKEFQKSFVEPIERGQCVDAKTRHVNKMKKRAHILHKMLEACVHRFDYTVLQKFLPPKYEYVISVQMSDIQCKLYRYYLNNLAHVNHKQGLGLFKDFAVLSRVWSHPKVLDLYMKTDNDYSPSKTWEENVNETKKRKSNDSETYESNAKVMKVDQPCSVLGLTEKGKLNPEWWKGTVMNTTGQDIDMEDYLDKVEHSGKLILLLDIITECTAIGDKILVFSQSLLTLDMIEHFLALVSNDYLNGSQSDGLQFLPYKQWLRDLDYLRMDGSTSLETRSMCCNTFNNPINDRCRLFLISTRAGSLGINLVAANRVIVFDSCWNPSHDTQSMFRVYRFGQKKPCYIYRFVAEGTMEDKIYSRQVTKMSTALRVIDEQQIKRCYNMENLAQLYEFTPSDVNQRETPIVPQDSLLSELLKRQKNWIVRYHEHNSLLEDQTNEKLSEKERKDAWQDYEYGRQNLIMSQSYQTPIWGSDHLRGFGQPDSRLLRKTVLRTTTTTTTTIQDNQDQHIPLLSVAPYDFETVINAVKAKYPNLPKNQMWLKVLGVTMKILDIHIKQFARVHSLVYKLKLKTIDAKYKSHFSDYSNTKLVLEKQRTMLYKAIHIETQVIKFLNYKLKDIMPPTTSNVSSTSDVVATISNMLNEPTTSTTGTQEIDISQDDDDDVITLA
ncbi:hypothetical protein Pmani_006392 [Petrolisthes manimaculis]|uniref:Transcriptional regulator ATRX n=1 Tax=Petrolisthes manimaculis TaxID=1843537 RepID=A0AAE1Q9X2_9EUCA|nr:hypothetical protein Pmani_006392 [Petrolisthes manimaculis]